MPVQRLPRYSLLLKDMLKYTGAKNPDFEGIQKALDLVKVKLDEINSNINKEDLEHTRKLIEIEESIEGQFEVVNKFT